MGMSDPFLIPEMSPHISYELNKLKSGAKVAWLGQLHPSMGKQNTMYQGIMDKVNVEIESDFYDLHNDSNIAENSYVWDVNSEWDFKNYDLIVAVRIFYACNSVSKLLKNLKKTINNGQKIVGDLMSGNNQNFTDEKPEDLPSHLRVTSLKTGDVSEKVSNLDEGDIVRVYQHNVRHVGNTIYEQFTKPAGSITIIPMLVEIWHKSGITAVAPSWDGTASDNIKTEFVAIPNHEDQILTQKHLEDNDVNIKNIHTFRDSVKKRIYSICEFSDES